MKHVGVYSFLSLLIVSIFTGCTSAKISISNQPPDLGGWTILKTVPYQGKQDDVFFLDRNVGWYGNGKGIVYKTVDGGSSWEQKIEKPGTFFRAMGFIDEKTGYAGNIGTDYFPGVTDTNPLYVTKDGGNSWSAVKSIKEKDIKGICAIDVLKTQFIDSGVLKPRTSLYVAGRVGGPAKLIISKDAGASWKKQDLSKQTSMIQDVKFINESVGFICSGSDANVEKSKAQILKTIDGGTTWKKVYESNRNFELTWKCHFPTDQVGYATVLNYDKNNEQKVILKTKNQGDTWEELPLVKDTKVKEFGIGFVDENKGWVGTADGIWQTIDGGKNWTHHPIGHAINKFRIVKDQQGTVVYAIGSEVLKLDLKN